MTVSSKQLGKEVECLKMCSYAVFYCTYSLHSTSCHMPYNIYIYIYIYIYKPRLIGVFDKYTTRVQGQRKFDTDKPQT